MRKSMIATAVVATAGLAASANAGYFQITNAQMDGSNISGGSFTLEAPTNGSWTASGVAESVTPMSAGNVTSLGTIGLTGSLANNVFTYFSFDVGGLGYFGAAFKNTSGAAVTFDVNFSRLNQATEGVDVTGATSSGTYSSGSGLGTWANSALTVNNGSTFLVVFGGLAVNNSPPVQGVVNFQAASTVAYLNHTGGTNWSNAATANGLTSNMQFAVYQVPVPAPVLLAGAGLVGAAALRRRMAKKA